MPKIIFDWLATHRLRLLVRVGFVVLLLAALLIPYLLVDWQLDKSAETFRSLVTARGQQIATWLRIPSAQFFLTNPSRLNKTPSNPLQLAVLPFDAVQVDDPRKLLQILDLVGCPIQYSVDFRLCASVGKSDKQDVRRIYFVGGLRTTSLATQKFSTKGRPSSQLSAAHRLRLTIGSKGERRQWILPVQQHPTVAGKSSDDSLGMVGYLFDPAGARVDEKRPAFTGAYVREGPCLTENTANANCLRDIAFSFQVARQKWRTSTEPVTPSQISIRLEVLAPGVPDTILFDTNIDHGAYSSDDMSIEKLLTNSEQITFLRHEPDGEASELTAIRGSEGGGTGTDNLIGRWLLTSFFNDRRLSPIVTVLTTKDGAFEARYRNEPLAIRHAMIESATAMVWFFVTIFLATLLLWRIFEAAIVKRIAWLTGESAKITEAIHGDADLGSFSLSEFRGRDELGVLASTLDDLLVRLSLELKRRKSLIDHDKEILRAIGHEILSPLQGLSARVDSQDAIAQNYIRRVLQAIRILYGSSSPAAAIEDSSLQTEQFDLAAFLRVVAENAHEQGIDGVSYIGTSESMIVTADQTAIEDVLTHILSNAKRYREGISPITLDLSLRSPDAIIRVRNDGPSIPEERLSEIFSYGVSDSTSKGSGRLGQGLFVAKAFMIKMGGSIKAFNDGHGVVVELVIPLSVG